jgi:hypothetical protein
MYLPLAFMDHVVISNGEMAMDVLKVHDVEFTSRPLMIVNKYLCLNWLPLPFCIMEIISACFTRLPLHNF